MNAEFVFPRWSPGLSVQLAISTVANTVAIPNTAGGKKPRFLMLTMLPGHTITGALRIAVSGGAATLTANANPQLNGVLDNGPLILECSGCNTVHAVCATGAGTLVVTPLENH